jgi:hypothetical protein
MEETFSGELQQEGYLAEWDIAAGTSVALYGGGKTVVGGYTRMVEDLGSGPPYEDALTVWRLNNNGSLDETLGPAGTSALKEPATSPTPSRRAGARSWQRATSTRFGISVRQAR